MTSGKELYQPDPAPDVGDMLILSGPSLPHAGDILIPEGYPGSMLQKRDWEGYVKGLTILPYFSAERIHSYAGRS